MERHGAEEDIVQQGEFGGNFYVIKSGQVEVLVADDGAEQVLSVLNAGDYFGEIALVENAARTATVRTTQPTELYSLDQADFAALLEREAGLRQAMAEIIMRREDELTAPSSAPRNGASSAA
jgi:CRP-like cAMP-binding protein